jgi:EAL domain-containing protein (putative c-di-GMP-specific phosphodiesterase class I)
MVSLLKSITERLFGPQKPQKVEPDDGGLAEFAKQFAKQLEHEEKFGKGPSVSADDVLSIQQGRYGSKSYMLDTSDFRKAIVPELRESIAPVTEGILKTRCGEKGSGYMVVRHLYVFHPRRKDPVEEYNAAMDIIDDIGERLLGDRYVTGERRINVPVAQIEPDEMFKSDGTFDLVRAKKTIKFIRESGTHGPATVDWENGDVKDAQGAPEWVKKNPDAQSKGFKEWQTQNHKAAEKVKGDWKKQVHQRLAKEQSEWQKVEQNAKDTTQKTWTTIKPDKKDPPAQSWKTAETKKNEETTAKSWTELDVRGVKEVKNTITPPQTKKKTPPPTPLPSKIGLVKLAFRPSWNANKEVINTFAACAYRKVDNVISHGEQIYSDDLDVKDIYEIDGLLSDQAAEHLKNTSDLADKIIVLPLHVESLAAPKRESPIKSLRQLSAEMRDAIWIEIVGITAKTSPHKVTELIKAHQYKFKNFGLRCELGDLSRTLVERSGVQFISCDVEASMSHGLHMRHLDQDLPDLIQLAQQFGKTTCTWGLRNAKDMRYAVQEGCAYVNGLALAKELRRPGKIVAMAASRLNGTNT